MKIRLLVDLPIPEDYGMKTGEIFEVEREVYRNSRGKNGYLVQGKNYTEETPAKVLVFYREAEVVKE